MHVFAGTYVPCKHTYRCIYIYMYTYIHTCTPRVGGGGAGRGGGWGGARGGLLARSVKNLERPEVKKSSTDSSPR